MKKYIFLFALLMAAAGVKADRKYATFVAPTGSGGSYDSSTGEYKWTKGNDNLMTIFTFSNGELANYTTLKVSNLKDGTMGNGGNWRVNLLFSDGKNKGFVWGNFSDKTITMADDWKDLTVDGVAHTLADVTAIRIGGNQETGNVKIFWPYVYLENDNDAVVTGAIGNVAGNSGASYDGLTATYKWTSENQANLMAIYSGAAGDFSKYSEGVLQVKFTMDENTNAVRIGYHDGSTFTEFGNGFYSTGTKQIDLSAQSSSAASATAIRFGARSANNSATSGTVSIRPDDVFLVRSEAYTRSFTANQKSTIWLPFALTAEDVASVKGKFYELTAAENGSLNFKEVTGATEAYKPYVFVASETGTPFSGMKTKTIVAPKTCSYTVGDYTFVGSMKDAKVPQGAFGYNSTNGTFSKATSENVTIAPFRAYIIGPATSGSTRLSVTFDDSDATAISSVESGKPQMEGTAYNLQGQRVGEGHKGLVIMNGHKVVIR